MFMKILYITTKYDPRDLNEGSGSDYQFYQAFLRMGADVKIAGPFIDNPSFLERVYRKFHHLFSHARYAKFSMRFLHESSKAVQSAINEFTPDLIFSKNIAPLVYCNSSIPIIYRMDTTLWGMHQQWHLFSEFEYKRMLQWERKVLNKTTLAITNSTWSADILIKEYHFPAEKILVFPNPASLPDPKYEQTIQIPTRISNPAHLLLVGKEKDRKGVDIAIKIVQLLNNSGYPAELRIVGQQGQDQENIHFMDYFKKTDPDQLEAYLDQYRWADLLIHPARFEAAGIVPSEAAIFGVPTITNSAGGLATTVEHTKSGIVLPQDSPPEIYAETIKELINHPSTYFRLCQTTRERYLKELNWESAGKTLQDALENLV